MASAAASARVCELQYSGSLWLGKTRHLEISWSTTQIILIGRRAELNLFDIDNAYYAYAYPYDDDCAQ